MGIPFNRQLNHLSDTYLAARDCRLAALEKTIDECKEPPLLAADMEASVDGSRHMKEFFIQNRDLAFKTHVECK